MGKLPLAKEKNVANATPPIEAIEVAIAEHFGYLHNIVVFNVKGWSASLPFYHECDVLVCSKAGYLAEIEIKRSWSDFLADFKKKHKHETETLKYFYYCVPESFDIIKMLSLLEDKRICYSGILTYDKECHIKVEYINTTDLPMPRARTKIKLTTKQQLELARLGSIRCVALKKKINKLKNGQRENN